MFPVSISHQERKANGFNHVRVLCPRPDFLLLRRYFDFNADLVTRAGTGDLAGLSDWRLAEYDAR